MNINVLGRVVAFAALAGTLLVSAITTTNREAPSTATSNTETAPAPIDPIDADLARCKGSGPEAARDDACKVAWAKNRERFFASGRPHEDKSIDAFTATPEWKGPQSPTTRTRDSLRPSGNTSVAN